MKHTAISKIINDEYLEHKFIKLENLFYKLNSNDHYYYRN